jgi:hypothetical protein
MIGIARMWSSVTVLFMFVKFIMIQHVRTFLPFVCAILSAYAVIQKVAQSHQLNPAHLCSATCYQRRCEALLPCATQQALERGEGPGGGSVVECLQCAQHPGKKRQGEEESLG